MDELARYSKAQWEELARSNVEYSRPWLDLDRNSAQERVYPFDVMKAVDGKQVLCLASGGGQQSAAFGLLGAQVTVFDLSETQLERDGRTVWFADPDGTGGHTGPLTTRRR
jgi:hypothetical protein